MFYLSQVLPVAMSACKERQLVEMVKVMMQQRGPDRQSTLMT